MLEIVNPKHPIQDAPEPQVNGSQYHLPPCNNQRQSSRLSLESTPFPLANHTAASSSNTICSLSHSTSPSHSRPEENKSSKMEQFPQHHHQEGKVHEPNLEI